ncbi:MAG: ABC transporter substrate-binding protein [Burkholderiales bacterium]|nr:ABC transporter substrate-binding protein [Burkholderiales bacterium]
MMSRRRALVGLGLVPLFACRAARARSDARKVSLAVGGKAALFYLPLTLAERLGYFAAEGLQVKILDFAGGAKALQAMMGGSADFVSGGIDHVLTLRARGQKLQSFVLQTATTSIALGVARGRTFRSAADLAGMKVGVTAPGSSTHMVVNHLLTAAGLRADDVSIIGVGTGPAAVAAMKAGHIDALANVEPAITILKRSGAMNVVVETMSERGCRQVFGELLPVGSLYTREAFIRQNPAIVQGLTNAMVKALLWLQKATPQQVLQAVPAQYAMGDPAVYLAAYQRSRPGYSRDGSIPAAGVAALYEALRRFDPAVRAAPEFDVGQAFDNRFVQQALKGTGQASSDGASRVIAIS